MGVEAAICLTKIFLQKVNMYGKNVKVGCTRETAAFRQKYNHRFYWFAAHVNILNSRLVVNIIIPMLFYKLVKRRLIVAVAASNYLCKIKHSPRLLIFVYYNHAIIISSFFLDGKIDRHTHIFKNTYSTSSTLQVQSSFVCCLLFSEFTVRFAIATKKSDILSPVMMKMSHNINGIKIFMQCHISLSLKK